MRKEITEEDTTQDIKGYLDLQAEKFREYLGSVSRHVQNERLKEKMGIKISNFEIYIK